MTGCTGYRCMFGESSDRRFESFAHVWTNSFLGREAIMENQALHLSILPSELTSIFMKIVLARDSGVSCSTMSTP